MNDPVKWALVDLLRLLDVIYGGEFHGELNRIAETLGVELPPAVEEIEIELPLPPSKD